MQNRYPPPGVAYSALVISIISLIISFMTYTRDERYRAVLSSQSLQELQAPNNFCNLVTLKYLNLSRYAADIRIMVTAEGFSLHYDRGDNHPSDVYTVFKCDGFVIQPNESITCQFRIHTLSDNPEQAKITIMVNGIVDRTLEYRYNSDSGSYIYIEK